MKYNAALGLAYAGDPLVASLVFSATGRDAAVKGRAVRRGLHAWIGR